MKKIYFMLLAILAIGFSFTACSDNEPFSTATADDDPRILDPIFPDGEDGNLPLITSIKRDGNLSMTLTVTPADYTTVIWQIDGYEVEEGTTLDISLKAGTYRLKVTVTTVTGKSTYREGIVQVNPLDDDPWASEVGFERIIGPGTTARLYGNNLDQVKSIVIGGKTITDIFYTGSDYIEYSVPTDLPDGEYRIIFVDAGGNEYGGDKVTATKSTMVTSGAARTNANSEWRMTGVNLDLVTSLTFNGQNITDFTQQTATEIIIICPDLADGEYTLTGKTKSGEDLQFYTTDGIITEQIVIVSSEMVLWEGHHYVSWDLGDDNPNKTFNLIGQDVFASIKAGSILSIYYSIAPEAEYHKLDVKTSNAWGDLPGTSAIEFSEDGVVEVVLTQEILNKIQEEGGFICVGHGYYVDMVTLQ